MTKPRKLPYPLSVAALSLSLAGCMLGPDYHQPPAVAGTAATALLRANQPGVALAPPVQRWWLSLHDSDLDWLIEQALQHNPNLRATEAQLRSARALVRQRRAELLPQVNASAAYANITPPDSIKNSVNQASESAAAAAQTYGGTEAAQAVRSRLGNVDLDTELYNVGFDASWELDVFGRRRRAEEGARAEAEASEARLADARVQMAAEVGQAYINYLGIRQRIAIAERNLEMVNKSHQLNQQRRERGVASEMDVQRSQLLVRQQEGRLPMLRAQAQIALDQLALLIGREPGVLDARLAGNKPLPTLPAVVPVDDAASLIRRRPDVRQAERELAASSAQIGQAIAGYFPQVTLFGSVGMTTTSPKDFNSDAISTLWAPFLRWSFLDFGRVKAQVAQARAGNDASAAAYEGKVLAALQDANGALARFGAARQQLVSAGQARESAARSADLVLQRYRAGATSLIDALDVQRQQLSAEDSQAQAQVELLVDYVALQKSLGLGWVAPPPAAVHRP
ncbi:TolC family protein [Acerihabitans sp.]|uniref:TolC family protein n=1 Tax=Acerihabitans sp. TaxID=2811394 RepID=UPI002EDA0F89